MCLNYKYKNIYFSSFQKSRGGGRSPPPQKNSRGGGGGHVPPGSPPMLERHPKEDGNVWKLTTHRWSSGYYTPQMGLCLFERSLVQIVKLPNHGWRQSWSSVSNAEEKFRSFMITSTAYEWFVHHLKQCTCQWHESGERPIWFRGDRLCFHDKPWAELPSRSLFFQEPRLACPACAGRGRFAVVL